MARVTRPSLYAVGAGRPGPPIGHPDQAGSTGSSGRGPCPVAVQSTSVRHALFNWSGCRHELEQRFQQRDQLPASARIGEHQLRCPAIQRHLRLISRIPEPDRRPVARGRNAQAFFHRGTGDIAPSAQFGASSTSRPSGRSPAGGSPLDLGISGALPIPWANPPHQPLRRIGTSVSPAARCVWGSAVRDCRRRRCRAPLRACYNRARPALHALGAACRSGIHRSAKERSRDPHRVLALIQGRLCLAPRETACLLTRAVLSQPHRRSC